MAGSGTDKKPWLCHGFFHGRSAGTTAHPLRQCAQPRSTHRGRVENEEIPEERLRLVFTCCNPVPGQKPQLALALRVGAGPSTVQRTH